MSRHALSNLGASLKTVVGGEIHGIRNCFAAAAIRPGNGYRGKPLLSARQLLFAMGFDCNAVAEGMTEVAAYGTAARATKRTA